MRFRGGSSSRRSRPRRLARQAAGRQVPSRAASRLSRTSRVSRHKDGGERAPVLGEKGGGADGDDVVVLTRATAAGESALQADVLTYRNGKVVKATTIGDTALNERVWGTK